MLLNTFLHIPYVGEFTEKKIWKNNIKSWDEFLTRKVDMSNKELIRKYLILSKEKYLDRDHEFFSKKLLYRYHWRAYPDFSDRCCFLDIETTGLNRRKNDITVIGVYDGKDSKVFVNGKNLHEFSNEIEKYSYIVTFNGACFDIPFLKEKFPDINFNQFHVDLRFALKYLGFQGGLKKIEKTLGLNRESGMTGLDAIKLWYKYKRNNDKKALDKLIDYNIEDIENLKILMELAYEKLEKKIHIAMS